MASFVYISAARLPGFVQKHIPSMTALILPFRIIVFMSPASPASAAEEGRAVRDRLNTPAGAPGWPEQSFPLSTLKSSPAP